MASRHKDNYGISISRPGSEPAKGAKPPRTWVLQPFECCLGAMPFLKSSLIPVDDRKISAADLSGNLERNYHIVATWVC